MKKILIPVIIILIIGASVGLYFLTPIQNRPSFYHNRIGITLTDEATLFDRNWMPVHFPEFNFSQVGDRGLSVAGNRNLYLYLRNPSRRNVQRAVELILDNEYVLLSRRIYHPGPAN